MAEDMAEELGADVEEALGGNGRKLETQLPGIVVKTSLDDVDAEELEDVHRRQLEWALEHAEEAKEATRM